MDKKLLTKKFFKDNPLNRMSSYKLAYFTITTCFKDNVQNAIWNILEDDLDPERKIRIEEERAEIVQLETGDEVVKFIRSDYDIVNREILCKKALTMQAEVIPPLLRRFKTSFQDGLVETAAFILAHAEQTYVDQLMELYPEIRNPYAQSMACLVFGVQEREDALPLLLEEYQRMKLENSTKDLTEDLAGELCQGPLLAIYILYGKA